VTTTHLLFDFFGTLVDYSPSRTEQGYERSFALLRDAGCALDYASFLALWSEVGSGFDRAAEESCVEFSMAQLTDAFFARAFERVPPDLVTPFVATYVDEWSKGVRYLDGVRDLLQRLSRRHTLSVVTNTHDPGLVPAHLERMGVAELFDVVVTSVEHGSRKPAPEIFRHALALIGADASTSIYVGDTYEADYVGATGVGMSALLIDPLERAPVPEQARLRSLLDLEAALARRTT
jgi:putative hydrolase of the HAD superfamily